MGIDSEIGEVLVTEDQLMRRIKLLGAEISRDYAGRDLLMLGILKGAVMFLADLMREITIPVAVDFMAVASYGMATKSSGEVRILKDVNEAIDGRDLLIVEDIVDTGLTLRYLLDLFEDRNPASVEVCALLSKPSARQIEVPVKYIGFEIPNAFVVGFGIDYQQRYRGLPYVGTLRER